MEESTHTYTFNGPFSGTAWVSRYQKGKTDLDFTEARDSEWQWNQPGHMQVCTSPDRWPCHDILSCCEGKTDLDFTEARDSEWQWHQPGHMQVCTSPDRWPCQHPTIQFFTGRMPFLLPNQYDTIRDAIFTCARKPT